MVETPKENTMPIPTAIPPVEWFVNVAKFDAPSGPAQDVALFARNLSLRVSKAKESIAKFAAKLVDADPADTISWGDRAFQDAANVNVYGAVLAALKQAHEKEGGIDAVIVRVGHVRRYATEKAIAAARSPQHSTSPCSNLMAQERGAAWVRVIEALDGFVLPKES